MTTDLLPTYDRISRVRYGMYKRMRFFGYLLTVVPIVVASSVVDVHGTTHAIPTMAVTNEGRVGTLIVNPSFVDRLLDEELASPLVHEVMHLANGVFFRQGTRDLARWIEAHDYAINLPVDDYIQEMAAAYTPWIVWPKGEDAPRCLDQAYRGLIAEEIYVRRAMAAEDADTSSAHEKPGQGTSTAEPLGAGVDSAGDGFSDAKDVIRVVAQTEKQREEQAQAVRSMVSAAVAAHEAQTPGGLPGSLSLLVKSILRTRTPWVDRLIHEVDGALQGDSVSYARLSRRGLALGLPLPGRDRRDPRVVWVVDTSLSSGLKELRRYFGVCREVLEARDCSVRLLQVDAAVQDDREIDDFLGNEFVARGQGGTSFTCLPDAIAAGEEDEVDLVLIFSDCQLRPEDWPPVHAFGCPVVVATTGEMPPPGYACFALDADPSERSAA